MNILCLGDVVGKPGRQAVKDLLDDLRQEYKIDFVIVNAENTAGGSGLTPSIADQFLKIGIDVITLGDHVWDQKALEEYLDTTDQVIRPANFPEGVPGKGWCFRTTSSGAKVGVINLLGRTFMRHTIKCPFKTLKDIVKEIQKETPIIIVDMHAEATSEKIAIGHFINGKVSAVVGTHTHVQTADETILADGTAYITDLGMSGPHDSVIGQKKEEIIQRFLTSMPIRFHVAQGDVRLMGVVIEVDESTGKAKKIVRFQKHAPERLSFSEEDEK